MGLRINEGKTKFIIENVDDSFSPSVKSKSGVAIGKVDDFLYLDSWIRNSEKDIKVRKAKAWVACHKLDKVWKSNLTNSLKIRLFTATVESVLLYGLEIWSMDA